MSGGSQDKQSVNERIPYDDPDLLDQLNKAVGGCCVFTLRYLFSSQLLPVCWFETVPSNPVDKTV